MVPTMTNSTSYCIYWYHHQPIHKTSGVTGMFTRVQDNYEPTELRFLDQALRQQQLIVLTLWNKTDWYFWGRTNFLLLFDLRGNFIYAVLHKLRRNNCIAQKQTWYSAWLSSCLAVWSCCSKAKLESMRASHSCRNQKKKQVQLTKWEY
jgi:hypothetical protein